MEASVRFGMVSPCEEFGCAAIMRTSRPRLKSGFDGGGGNTVAFYAKAGFVQALADEAALFAEPQARRKREICCLSDCTWSSRLLVAAEVSSTKAAFCWVAWSSCMTAWLI